MQDMEQKLCSLFNNIYTMSKLIEFATILASFYYSVCFILSRKCYIYAAVVMSNDRGMCIR